MPDQFPQSPGRRRLLGHAVALSAGALAFPAIARGRHQALPDVPTAYSTRAIDLVRESLVIDMLGVIKIDFRPEYYASRISEQDAADMRASGITGFHHAIGIGGPDAYQDTLAYLAAWNGFVGRNSHVFTLVGEAEDLDRAKADGKAAIIMGVQNAEQFRTPADVRMFYLLGMRCAQLTYNAQNLIGAGATRRIDGGGSDFGVPIASMVASAISACRSSRRCTRPACSSMSRIAATAPRWMRSTSRPARSPSPIPTAARSTTTRG